MQHYFRAVFLWLILAAFAGCGKDAASYEKSAANPTRYHRAVRQVTDIIVHDIFAPTVCSRIYAYTTISGFEAIRHKDSTLQTLAGQLNGLTPVPAPEAGKTYCYPLAGIHALLLTGKALTFSEDKMEEYIQKNIEEFKTAGVPDDVVERSVAYGKAVSDHILDWSKKDNYKETRSFPKYSITKDPAKWRPTPPQYADALEPHWKLIRHMVLDSANQFRPIPPTPFTASKSGAFFNLAQEVYHILDSNKEERTAIAAHWDDNPFANKVSGHVTIAVKKINPGGHWLNLAGNMSHEKNLDINKCAEVYMLTSIALFDGFISCWDAKYHYQYIRPETAINTQIDEDWRPFIETPPFPEYTSGHSVISAASAEVMTALIGDNISFTDSTEVAFGLPPRKLNSFREAAIEASYSRLYGGIHFREALERGNEQGRKVGQLVLSKIKTRK